MAKKHSVKDELVLQISRMRGFTVGSYFYKEADAIIDKALTLEGMARINAVDVICLELGKLVDYEFVYWGTNTPRFQGHVDAFINQLVLRLLEKDVEPLFEIMFRSLLRVKDPVPWGKVLPPPLNSQKLESMFRVRARARFFFAFLEEAGKSLESSIKFALGIAEVWNTFNGGRPMDVELLNSRSYFETEYVERSTRPFQFLHEILTTGHGEQIHMVKWVERLIDHADTSRVAEEALASLVGMMALFPASLSGEALLGQNIKENDEVFQRFSGALDKATRDQEPEVKESVQRAIDLLFNPRIKVREPYATKLRSWLLERVEIERAARDEARPLIEQFRANLPKYEKVLEDHRRAIQDDFNCWLRPGGYDHIEIRIAPLHNVGVRAVIFHPEGFDFPDSGIQILVRKETPHLTVFKTNMSDLKVKLHNEVVRNKLHLADSDLLEKMLEFIIIDVVRRLVVTGRPLRAAKPSRLNPNGEIIDADARQWPVRPHFRRLSEGHAPSAEARERARKEYGWRADRLPPGKTFVKAHMSKDGNGLTYDLPTQPTVVYTQDDLRNALDLSSELPVNKAGD